MTSSGTTNISSGASLFLIDATIKDLSRKLTFDGFQFGITGGSLRMNGGTVAIQPGRTAQFSATAITNNGGTNAVDNKGEIQTTGTVSIAVPYLQSAATGTLRTLGNLVLSGGGEVGGTVGRRSVLDPPVVIVPGAELHVAIAGYRFGSNLAGAMGARGGRLVLDTGAAATTINGDVNLSELSLASGSVLRFLGVSSVASLGSLMIAGGPAAPVAQLDLGESGMIIGPVPNIQEAEVRQYLLTGYMGGTFGGNGITSSASLRIASRFSIGYSTAGALGISTFLGQPVQPNDVVLRLTRTGDANLDGKTDLADFNRLASSFGITTGRVWRQGDFNYDGAVNLADFNLLASNFAANALAFATQVQLPVGQLPHTAAQFDLNQDGRPEIVAANQDSGTVSIFVNQTIDGAGTPVFAAPQVISVGLLPVSVASDDFNQDGKKDLAVANAGSNTLSILYNMTLPGAASVSFVRGADLVTGNRPRFVVTADFNNDLIPDLASANYFADSVSIFLNSATPGAFLSKQDSPPGSVGAGPLGLATGDFDLDSRTDLAVANQDSNSITILRNLSTGNVANFITTATYTVGDRPRFVTAALIDSDARLDLVTANEFGNSVSVLLSSTTSPPFSQPQSFPAGTAPLSVSIADLNGDGKNDLAVADFGDSVPGHQIGVLLNMTAPAPSPLLFVPAQPLEVGNRPIFVQAGDLNRDGRPDLSAANFDANSVSILFNKTLPPALDKGHLLLLERGLQIQGDCFPASTFSLSRLQTANFTAPYWQLTALPDGSIGTAPGVPWGRWATSANDTSLLPSELPFASTFGNFQFLDERDFDLPQERALAAGWFNAVRSSFPNTLLYTDQGTHVNPAATPNIALYIAQSNPDMLMFNHFPFTPGGPVGGSPTTLYDEMQRFRQLGLGGVNFGPRPYGMYIQTFSDPPNGFRAPSDSEMRLNQFAAWTFGYTFVSAFTFNDPFSSTLFTNGDPASPTPAYFQIAETNRQSRNLGPALVRLRSTDVRFINGEHSGGSNPTPMGMLNWIPRASDPYITSIVAGNLGTANAGLPGDLLVGYFAALDEAFDGPGYTGESYFMLTNGLSDPATLASETRQRIILNFDFRTSGINSLQRLSRTTGLVETVPLMSLGGSTYRLVLDLDGGTGDLFKFNTGAPFIGASAGTVSSRAGEQSEALVQFAQLAPHSAVAAALDNAEQGLIAELEQLA
jgi:hypothetical protein